MLTISGGLYAGAPQLNRVFRHTGTGTLEIDNLTIGEAKYSGANAHGGCIFSNGNVQLVDSVILLQTFV
jgi:hypothetical protein